MRAGAGAPAIFSEVELPIYGVLRSSPVEQGVKLLLQGRRLLSAPDGRVGRLTPCGLGASASLLGGALLLLRGRLARNWLPRFRGSLGLNRHHLSIIRINRLYLGLYGVLLPLGRRLQAAIFLLLLGRRLQATILLLPLGRQLEATILLLSEGPPLLLVGTDDPAISVEAAALAHAPATDCGASPRAVSSSP